MTRLPSHPAAAKDLSLANLLHGLIRVRDLPEILPLGRNGAKLSMSTIWRWRRKGRDGRKLPVITIAGVAYVRGEDLVAFLAPEPPADAHPADEPPDHPDRKHGRRHKAVEDTLAEEFGV